MEGNTLTVSRCEKDYSTLDLIQGENIEDNELYQLSLRLSMQVYQIVQDFPSHEQHALSDQLLFSSRYLAVNIAKAWSVKDYKCEFERFILDAISSTEETKSWLMFAVRCSCINLGLEKMLRAQCELILTELKHLIRIEKTE